MLDNRQYALATQRNREPILEVLLSILPLKGNILEISSGTGEHAAFFAEHLPRHRWIPSDPNPAALDSIEAWRKHAKVDNLQSSFTIDARDSVWPVEDFSLEINAIVNINMIHIAPWTACLGLLSGASRILPRGGILYLYGPFKRNGEHTAESNLIFDHSLRQQNPQWGVRNLEEVIATAKSYSLDLVKIVEMPANNLSVVFRHIMTSNKQLIKANTDGQDNI